MLMQSAKPLVELENSSEFIARHIGIDDAAEAHMLNVLGAASRRALMEAIIPPSIARTSVMAIPAPVTEAEALRQLKAIAAKQGAEKLYRPGLLRHAHTRRDLAQHFRKPRLVHRVHAVSG